MQLNMLDRTNQAWYGKSGSVAGMARDEGFADAGERAAYHHLFEEMRGRPILDLGVGAGRTVPLLRGMSHNYLGLDYLAPMLEAAQARFPDSQLRLGDARDLSDLPQAHYGLVVFSCQGLDSVDHADREAVLQQAWNVLAPGGVFWFSTLNRDGPAARYRPWHPVIPPQSPLRDRARAWLRVPLHLRRYQHGLTLAQRGEDWAVAPFFAGGWHLVAHYTTLNGLLDEVARTGFAPNPVVYEDKHGHQVAAGDDLTPVFSFNVLARKPGALPPRDPSRAHLS